MGIQPTDGVIDAGIDRSMIMHYLSGIFFDITAMLLVSIYVWVGMKGEEVGYVPWLNCPQISHPPWHSLVLRGGASGSLQ